MKVVIDLRIFGPESGGLGRYNQKFLEELIKIDRENHYYLIFREKPEINLPDNFKIVLCDCRWYSFKEQLVLPFVLYKLKADLVHFTHFNVPLLYSGKFIVTIHDLIMTKFPSRRASTLDSASFSLKYWVYNQVIRNAVKNAEKIIAVSKFTAQDIKNYFKISDREARKIKVVYEGVSWHQSSQSQSFDLPNKFLLYVGNAYPHKNLDFLIHTFKDFLKKHSDYHLVLVGKKDYFYQRLAKENKEVPNVIFAGFVSDDKLPSYYQQAKAYVFPSLYEGFGLPPLEAMHYNLPVLSSSAASLPEILGQAALYFEAEEKDDLLDKLEQIISDQAKRQELIQLGQEQTKKYSWAKMAKEILDTYIG